MTAQAARWPDESLPVRVIEHRYEAAPPVYYEDLTDPDAALIASIEAVR